MQNRPKQVLELSEEKSNSGDSNQSKPVDAKPLSTERLKELAALLPPMQKAGVEKKFEAISYTKQPPPVTKVIEQEFPPKNSAGQSPGKPERVKTVPLKVTRVSHTGDVESVNSLKITFSQPMVSVSAPEANDAIVPVKLSPKPAGVWHWNGTQTIEFQPKAKTFPNATTFKIEIPAGTTSISGAKLTSAYTSSFATPAPRVDDFETGKSGLSDVADSLSPLMVLQYHQHVDPNKVIKFVSGKVHNKPIALRLATAQEIKQAESNQSIEQPENGTSVYLKPRVDLPKNSEATIVVAPGVPSKEGPNKGLERQEFSVQTYAPFVVSLESKAVQTMWTGQPIQLSFNNELNSEVCKPSMFSVFPAVKKFAVKLDDSSGASISGDFKLGVIYTIKISSGLVDIYGQHLSGTHVVRYTIKPRPPQIFHPAAELGQMIPSAKPVYHLFTYNEPSVKVSILQASSTDWNKYEKAYNGFSADKKAVAKSLSSLKVLLTRTFQTSGHLEQWNDVRLDLNPFVKDGNTHLIVVVEAPEGKQDTAQRFVQWVEYSSIRVNVFNDSKSLYAMVTDVRTGKAVSGAELTLLPNGAKRTSDKDGLTKFVLDNGKQDMLVCNHGTQSTILPHGESWHYTAENGAFIAYQNTDRNLYRPGEIVHVNGLIRWSDWLKNSELVAPNDPVEVHYSIKASDSTELANGVRKTDKSGGFSFEFAIPQTVELGTASIALSIKKAGVAAKYDGGSSNFQIQEFRRPEFEVTVNSDKSEMVLGDFASITATGLYRTGSAMPHSKVHWQVNSKAGNFSAPDFGEFSFTGNTSSFEFSDTSGNDAETSVDGISASDGADKVRLKCAALAVVQPVDLVVNATIQDLNRQEWTQNTSVKVHPASVYVGLKKKDSTLKPNTSKVIEFVVTDTEGKVQPDYAVHLTASHNVTDDQTNEYTEKILQELDVPSAKEVKSCTFDFKEPGEYFVTAKVTDRQGRPNLSRISLQVESDEPSAEGATPDAQKVDQHQVVLTLNKENYKPGENAEISLAAPFASGHGVLVAKSNLIVNAVPFDVINQKATITLPILDTFYPQIKGSVYVFGPNNATASGEVDVNVPTDPVNLSVTAATQSDSYQPGQTVSLKIGLKDAQGAALAGGQVALAVVDESILALTDYSWNNPLLSFYSTKNYFGDDIFSPTLINAADLKPQYIDQEGSESSSLPPPSALPPPPLPEEAAVGGKSSDGMVPPPPPIPSPAPAGLVGAPVCPRFGQSNDADDTAAPKGVKLRSDLNPLAYYNPAILTGSDGTANVTFNLPGNLTKYKVMAVAAKGSGQFGSGSSIFTASLPLMVRPSLPRFLNFKDQCELPFVVQNTTDKPVSAELVMRASNLGDPNLNPSDKTGSNSNADAKDGSAVPEPYMAGRSFEIPANDRVEIRLPVAVNSSGTADIQVATFAGASSDASELSIPLQSPVTSESFATYGQLDEGSVAQKIAVPTNVINQVGGLEITTSSTAMQQLFDAGEYLQSYPFACSEQLSSQLLGLGALGDLTSQFKTAVNDVKANELVSLQKIVVELCKRQQADGGFGLWVKDEKEKYPFVSIQCARALFECSKRQIPVPQHVLDLCKTYLKTIESRIPKEYLGAERISLVAYALNVRFQMNDSDSAKAKKLLSDSVAAYSAKSSKTPKTGAENRINLSLQELLPRAMSMESMAWLLPVLYLDSKNNAKEIDAVQNILSASIDETSSTASINDNPYGDLSYLMYYSPSRLNAIVLESLISSQPKNDVIPKMVKGLLQQRRNGRWLSTQENACSLLALSKYFSVYEKDVPDFVAQFWLGEKISFEEKFVGRNLDSNEMKIPMEYLQTHMQDELLTLAKQGAGRLYYRVGMKCASKDLKMPATSRGFTVERTYVPVDSASDVTRDAAGTLHVKSGATVKVVVKITTPGMRYHVAMVDPFPAGFEALNPDTVGTRPVSEETSGDVAPDSEEVDRIIWTRTWFDHQNFRDNQAEAFTTLLYNGQVEYTYFVRATTPGTFIVPPCKVEEMYAPETFGRTGTEVVVIR
ncbi:MAG: hypothetical protein HYX67_08820 [Candidatus Melainabacteria bacterium]|nr:hypothetical protein [Candidatus Melainabacteria bacterium]